MSLDPNIAIGVIVPPLCGLAGWAFSRWQHARQEARTELYEDGLEAGRAEQLRAQQAAVTEAFHKRLDEIETLAHLVPGLQIQAERHDRILEAVRDACVRADLMPPSDTQVGRDGRGVPNPLNRSPSKPPPPPRIR